MKTKQIKFFTPQENTPEVDTKSRATAKPKPTGYVSATGKLG